MCDYVKTKREEIINSFNLPTWFKREDEFNSGRLSNGKTTKYMNLEEIEYKLGCGIKTYPYIQNEIFSQMDDDDMMIIPDGILCIWSEHDGLTLRVSKENYTYTEHDDYTKLIDRYGSGGLYGFCLTQDCKYMCVSEYGNLNEVYGNSCFKKQNKDESIAKGLEIIDNMFKNYLKEVDTFSNTFMASSKRLLVKKNILENNNEKGCYYEDIAENYYMAYVITPATFIQIHQKTIQGKNYQMKMVKSLSADEKTFTIHQKMIMNKQQVDLNLTVVKMQHVLDLLIQSIYFAYYKLIFNRNIDEKCPSETYETVIPLGTYSFTTAKLTIDAVVYDLIEMGICYYFYV